MGEITQTQTDSEVIRVGSALERKGATGPCPLCKNNSFLVVSRPSSMDVVFCSNCGLKFEHLPEILMDPDTSNTDNSNTDDV